MSRILSVSKIFVPALIVLTMVLFSSCKKDKQDATITVEGSWRDITRSNPEPGYYIFTGDRKLYTLSSRDSYKETEFAIYKASASQISIQNLSGTKLYNLRYAGDTLLFNDGSKDAIKLLKDNLAPKTISDWTSPVLVSDRFIDTAEAKTIAYYSNTIYTFKYYSVGSRLLAYNASTHTVALSNADNAYYGLDFAQDGTMWCVLWGNAYKFNPATGVNTFKSADLSSNSLWATAVNGSTLYNYASAAYISYDVAGDDWGSARDVENDVTDLAYANGFLYVAKGGMIYKMHPFYHIPVQSWYLENFDIQGIAYTGTDFWLAAKGYATGKHEMLKVTLN